MSGKPSFTSGLMAAAFAAVLLFRIGPAAAATVAFNNFGAGDTFNTGLSGTLNSTTEQALVFTAGATGAVTLVEAPMHADSQPIDMTLSFYTSGGAVPGTFLGSASATIPVAFQANASILDFTGWSVSLTAGLDYWLVSSVILGSAGWNIASTDGIRYFQQDGNGWTGPFENQLAARISVSPVPLPAAFPLMLGGLGIMGLAGLRRRRSRTGRTTG